jgi:hypothetical protein
MARRSHDVRRMTHRHAVILGCALFGCSLQTSLTGGTSTGPRPTTSSPSTSSPSVSSSSTSAEPASASAERNADAPRAGYVDCSNREEYLRVHRESCDPREPVIVGLSVEDAKKKLTAIGFTGPVKVSEQYEFDASCKADHVCGFEPRRWYVEERVTLVINRKLAIGVPE